jgi:hypothetical protein
MYKNLTRGEIFEERARLIKAGRKKEKNKIKRAIKMYIHNQTELEKDVHLMKYMTLKSLKEYGKEFNKIVTEFKGKMGITTNYKIAYTRASKKEVPKFINLFRDMKKTIGRVIEHYVFENSKKDMIRIFREPYDKTPKDSVLLVTFKSGRLEGQTRTVNAKMLTNLAYISESGEGDGGQGSDTSSGGPDGDGDPDNDGEREYNKAGDKFKETKFVPVIYTKDDFIFKYKKIFHIPETGGYFNYLNASKLDLSQLQIYNKCQYQELLNSTVENCCMENCIIHSLRMLKIEEPILNKLKTIIQKYDKGKKHDVNGHRKSIINDDFIARNLKVIAPIIGKNILLKKFYTTPKGKFIEKNMTTYKCGLSKDSKGNFETETIQLCLYKNHYMANMELNINKCVVKNYNDIKDMDNFINFTRKRGCKYTTETSTLGKATTTDIIRMLDKHILYYKDEILTKHINYTEKDNTFYLYGDNEQHEIIDLQIPQTKAMQKKATKKIFFADCETYTQSPNLVPFLMGIVSMDNDTVIFTQTVKDFLGYVVSSTKDREIAHVYFHNAKFDYSVMFNDFMKESPTIKNNQFYQGVIRYGGKRIIILDSLKHISIPLSKFKDTYKLKVGKKDIYMPYSLYNKQTITMKTVNYELLKIDNDDKEVANIEKLNTPEKEECIEEFCFTTKKGVKKFKHMDFMVSYLESDCLTLKHGFLKHRESIFKLCEDANTERLDIFDILTTSSLSYKLYKSVGTYNNVFELSGNKRRFVQESIIGGRVSTKRNKKHISKFVMDYDACSLYPSAIYRLKQEYGGIPCGEAKNITNFDDIKYNTYYVVEIKVNAINDNQQISFFNFIDKNGTRRYSGDYKEFRENNESGKIIVDRITLEDYVKYQGMEYEFIQGLYWDEFNPIMSEKTHDLYELRKKYKNMKVNGKRTDFGEMMQSTTKLILNSIYGKTLLKPTMEKIITKANKIPLLHTKKTKLEKDSDDIYQTDENGNVIYRKPAKNYLSKNYTVINYMVKEKLVTTFHITHNDFEDKNSCHVGGMILSMSKRIMNEVMGIANENNIEVLYQDTDSMHIPKKDIEALETIFKAEFGRNLRGENLGEFHNDLEATFVGNTFNCVSEKCIILGKKAYLDILVIDFDCEKNKKLIEYKKLDMEILRKYKTEHIRLKGVGAFSLKQNYKDAVGVYEALYKGETRPFNLVTGRVKLQIRNMNNVIKRDEFVRNVSF